MQLHFFDVFPHPSNFILAPLTIVVTIPFLCMHSKTQVQYARLIFIVVLLSFGFCLVFKCFQTLEHLVHAVFASTNFVLPCAVVAVQPVRSVLRQSPVLHLKISRITTSAPAGLLSIVLVPLCSFFLLLYEVSFDMAFFAVSVCNGFGLVLYRHAVRP